jgi:hypothetical protein
MVVGLEELRPSNVRREITTRYPVAAGKTRNRECDNFRAILSQIGPE